MGQRAYLPSVHQEIVYPSHKRTQNFSVCRCWQSTKFPICDNSHKVLQKQGCNCGPAMLEIRQAPSVEEPRAFKSTAGTSKDNPSAGVLFGGAASVAAAVAARVLMRLSSKNGMNSLLSV
ncbi:Clone ZZD536 mRNA sequence-like protein, related [Eimeria maxima]|uniref:Clone ZZD536 mRNA sequence-like protein, related n=1 Tax=Eimeria maxima TaxID=5804 RepID=U6MB44_EIMMA|nr:Clone ZZD536 mRNA sequence-like protein, related [Eimeria maxima]CDJ60273.1 Clone ZZD536 mRNA sequence-like protein, related [Eimeria maxima]